MVFVDQTEKHDKLEKLAIYYRHNGSGESDELRPSIL
jgi:hypothetical protein